MLIISKYNLQVYASYLRKFFILLIPLSLTHLTQTNNQENVLIINLKTTTKNVFFFVDSANTIYKFMQTICEFLKAQATQKSCGNLALLLI